MDKWMTKRTWFTTCFDVAMILYLEIKMVALLRKRKCLMYKLIVVCMYVMYIEKIKKTNKSIKYNYTDGIYVMLC